MYNILKIKFILLAVMSNFNLENMKRCIYLLSFISIFILSSCSNFLDMNPLDQISDPTFWKSKDDFDNALTAVYGSMQAAEFSSELPLRDCMTDNGFAQFNSGNDNDIVQGNISPSTGGYQSSIYNDSYSGIARINVFLQQLSNYKGTDISASEKSDYEGEVRFIRAFYYFQLYSIYGDVPLVLDPLTMTNQEQPKVPAQQILTQILSDLNFAIANLPDVSYSQNGGHAVSTSAEALEARVLLFAAYDTTGTPNLDTLKHVRDLALHIETEYSLSPNFQDLFRVAGQKNNPEIIFSINFLAPNNTAPWDMYYGDWVAASPLKNLVDDFECTDGKMISESPLYDSSNSFENRDPRLAMTIYDDHPDFGDGKVWYPSNAKPTGYGVMKYLDPANLPFGFSTLSGQDAVVLRLGEILLMYAEAENEIAGPDASVYDAMTTLRARVGMPPYPQGLSKTQMREKIRHERRIELAFEGLRWYDLKRWRTADEVMNSVTDGIIPYHFEDKFYDWPLPQTEIDKSQGILVQNPDYQ